MNDASTIDSAGAAAAGTRPVPTANADVLHIPGEDGLPWFGMAREFLTDPRGMSRRMRDTYGPVFRTRFIGQRTVSLSGVEGLELVLLDRDKNFSSEQGWDHTIGRFFRRGLMLLDFDEHRFHRRIMQAAFKRDALEHYMASMDEVVERSLSHWRESDDFRFYPAVKQLTLDNAAVAFLGIALGSEADRLNTAFIDSVAASIALIRIPIPGLGYWRGLKGRELLQDFFRTQIPERRKSNGQDMFTRLCHATDDEGRRFSDDDIVDHMIFLMMAAHDTLTSSLTTAAYGLAAHPEWQQRLRAEAAVTGDGPLAYDQLDALPQTEWVFNEALRMWGPVPFVPRRTQREFEFQGVRIPANVQVGVSPDAAHYDPAIWTDPERFDPERFSPDRAEHKRHLFAFCPYGGGAHKCIGMHFALILAKVMLRRLVMQFDIALPDGRSHAMQHLPIPKPKDGLPLILTPRG
ncbi:MAG: cytochrome P450 [Pseudomonadota bacterium]